MEVSKEMQIQSKVQRVQAYTKMITLTLTADDKALLLRLDRAEHKGRRALVRQLLRDVAGLSTSDQMNQFKSGNV